MLSLRRTSEKKYQEEIMIRKQHSVSCQCGHRVYIDPRIGIRTCGCCGTKLLSKREWFRLKVREAIERLKIKQEMERGI